MPWTGQTRTRYQNARRRIREDEEVTSIGMRKKESFRSATLPAARCVCICGRCFKSHLGTALRALVNGGSNQAFQLVHPDLGMTLPRYTHHL